jgi:hypothetical protein
MKKYLLWIVATFFLGIGLIHNIGNALTVYLPRSEGNDIKSHATVVYTDQDHDSSKSKVLERIAFINRYLWFSIGILCFWFIIYNGIKMISGSGDEKSKSLKSLIWSIIGIVICTLSYALVNLLVNLFS